MKISIGINAFKSFDKLNKREKFCVESLYRLKEKFSNIDLFLVTFEEDKIEYPNFITLNKLKKSSVGIIQDYFKNNPIPQQFQDRLPDIDNNTRKMPIVNEIFDVLANTDSDLFIFLNSDIILSDRFIKEITEDYESYPCSRGHIYDIDTLKDTPVVESYSVHGFDVFAVKNTTWKTISSKFKDFILGHNYWDTYFFTMLNFLTKAKNVNKLPICCFHIEHQSDSSDKTYVDNIYNETVFANTQYVCQTWFKFVYDVLLTRPTHNNIKWYVPHSNEIELEKTYFNPSILPSEIRV